jgi:uncharacterized protein YjbI with pentapeptide repeats
MDMKPTTVAIATLLTSLSLTLPARAENLEHSRQLLSTRQCPGCDLSNAGLIFAELSGANLSRADLSRANLSRANLQGADLRGANLMGASLNGANLTGARLDGANLMAADLRDAYLTGAVMDGATVNGALLEGAIGLPTTIGTAEDFYQLAIQDERRRDYVRSTENFTQVIIRKPTFAPAYFGRAAARAQGGDRTGAIADAREAERLFNNQGDQKNAELANKFAMLLEHPPEEKQPKGGNGIGTALLGLLGGALQIFLKGFSIVPFL